MVSCAEEGSSRGNHGVPQCSLGGGCGAVLLAQICEVGLGVDPRAGRALERLLRHELPAVAVDVLAEPLAERRELAALELVVEVREILLDALPDLNAHHVAERI